jgi:prevent-host-death family protein
VVIRDRSQTISAFEAKTRLGRLLDRVQAGEELLITRHGRPVARLAPVLQDKSADNIDQALATFREIRKSLKARGVKVSRKEIREWISEQ